MKIKLLNDGGYPGLYHTEFPVEVKATRRGVCFMVSEEELERIGADMEPFQDEEDPFWPFLSSEVEVSE